MIFNVGSKTLPILIIFLSLPVPPYLNVATEVKFIPIIQSAHCLLIPAS